MLRALEITFCVCLMVVFSEGQNRSETFTCYSCTYVRSSDPTIGIKCVDNPAQVAQGSATMSCQVPNQCTTKSHFEPDKKTVRSFTRGCLPPASVCDSPKCCSLAGTYPICEHKCHSDLCNADDAKDLSDIMVDPDSNPNMATRTVAVFSMVVPMLMAVVLQYV